jgi:hypothetical protein
VHSRLLVTPNQHPKESAQRRAEIARYARADDIRTDASIPQCFTHCFLAHRVEWDPASKWQQRGDTLFDAFQRWGEGNPRTSKIDRATFDRHVKRWLLATSLTFSVDGQTDAITHIQGISLVPARDVFGRKQALARFADLDRT